MGGKMAEKTVANCFRNAGFLKNVDKNKDIQEQNVFSPDTWEVVGEEIHFKNS